jgi:hypothetical protein
MKYKQFISLEWKSFLRSASLGNSIILKIFMGIGAIFMIFYMLFFGIGTYYLIKETLKLDVLKTINQAAIYYFGLDFVFRYFMQKMPVSNIKSYLSLGIKKNKIVHYTLFKTIISMFNTWHLFYFIPLGIVLTLNNFSMIPTLSWTFSMLALVYIINFLNILIHKKDSFFYTILGIIAISSLLMYFNIFDITSYTSMFFIVFYDLPFTSLALILLLVGIYRYTFNFYKQNLYFDQGLSSKEKVATSENISWLDKYGVLGTFLKNDIRMILRNKRSKTTVFMSFFFVFYGLIFFSTDMYQGSFWKIFASTFITGGFLLNFGQFVPSWDSAYYPLLMTQKITYKDYLNSKWWLMVLATAASTILASFYLIFGLKTYLIIISVGIFNIGVNSHLILWAGAYIKTPIDLTKNNKVFGDKQSFNFKTFLLSVPKIILPFILFLIGKWIYNENFGLILIALVGVIGWTFKNKVFTIIEKIYLKEKYKTLAAYQQKN